MSALIATDDGSLTCRDATTGELYHNRAGAFSEACHNYCVPSGALQVLKAQRQLRLLDACFGLGYNTFVLLEQMLASELAGSISIVAVEIDDDILAAVSEVLTDRRLIKVQSLFANDVPSGFGVYQFGNGALNVKIDIRKNDLRRFLKAADADDFDLVFHDPFSPARVPELWTLEIFERYYQLLAARKGKVLTYSSAYAVRGGMQQAGFHVFRTTSVGGKSGGTLAAVAADTAGAGISELTSEERAGIARRSGVPYRDPGFVNSRQDILARRSQEQALWEINRPA